MPFSLETNQKVKWKPIGITHICSPLLHSSYHYLLWGLVGFRVCMHLENCWIPGVWFQGLESTWNWFSVLESPWVFYRMRLKNINAFEALNWIKASEIKCSGKQNITFSMLMKCVKTLVFRSQCSLSLLLRMYVELRVYSICLVCTCFQALILWHFCMCVGV